MENGDRRRWARTPRASAVALVLAAAGSWLLVAFGWHAAGALEDAVVSDRGVVDWGEVVFVHRRRLHLLVAAVTTTLALLSSIALTRHGTPADRMRVVAVPLFAVVAASLLVSAALLDRPPTDRPYVDSVVWSIVVALVVVVVLSSVHVVRLSLSTAWRVGVTVAVIVVVALTALGVRAARTAAGEADSSSMIAERGWSPIGADVLRLGAPVRTTVLPGSAEATAIPGGVVRRDGGALVATDSRTGDQRWSHRKRLLGLDLQPSVWGTSRTGDVLVVWTAPGTVGPEGSPRLVSSHDPETGVERWTRPARFSILGTGPTGVVITYSLATNQLSGLDPATGNALWVVGAEGVSVQSEPVVGDRLVGLATSGANGKGPIHAVLLDATTGATVRDEEIAPGRRVSGVGVSSILVDGYATAIKARKEGDAVGRRTWNLVDGTDVLPPDGPPAPSDGPFPSPDGSSSLTLGGSAGDGSVISGPVTCDVHGLPLFARSRSVGYDGVAWTRDQMAWSDDEIHVLDLRTCAKSSLPLPPAPPGRTLGRGELHPMPGGWQLIQLLLDPHEGTDDRWVQVTSYDAG